MGGTRWLDADQQQAWRTILRHHVLTLDRLDADLQAGHQIDLADYEILVRLSEAAEGRVRMSELARLSLVSRSRLTHRVDRLEAGGWVVRRPCPTDRRGMNAELTIEGR
ncbi:MAG TPA: MarR family transcriptional regulator, partial [Acidimicrobiales bacterium]